MTREIKFRAWDKNLKGWIIEEVFIRGNSVPYILRKNMLVSCDDAVLMQYTGLKDKNGKEIYEGDIMKCEVAIPAKQYWNEVVKMEDGFWSPFNRVLTDRTEIIGNIYENPNLLKED